ncbi:MAG: glycosyltransferase family 4 protein [Methanomicrobia archaeon]|nr:glycosyltransferase family 4 protein [Methanomicrobia archaeon]
MEKVTLAEVADFNETICPIDRNRHLIADFLEKQGFEVTPLRGLNKSALLKIILSERFDILHGRSWAIGKTLVRVIRHEHFINSVHGFPLIEECRKAGPWLCNKADIVHVVYSLTKERIMNRWRVPEEKVRVIYNPVDIKRFTPSPHNNERIKVLYVSSYTPWKAPETIPKLAKQFPNLDFEMYGSWSDTELYQKIYAESLNLPNLSVNKAVPHDRLIIIYQNADIFIFPCVQGGFGNVVQEAMSSGLPVIALREGMDEIINDRNGFLCANHNELKDCLQSALESNLEKMGAEARKTMVEKCSRDVIFNKMLQMYKEVMEI